MPALVNVALLATGLTGDPAEVRASVPALTVVSPVKLLRSGQSESAEAGFDEAAAAGDDAAKSVSRRAAGGEGGAAKPDFAAARQRPDRQIVAAEVEQRAACALVEGADPGGRPGEPHGSAVADIADRMPRIDAVPELMRPPCTAPLLSKVPLLLTPPASVPRFNVRPALKSAPATVPSLSKRCRQLSTRRQPGSR
jgi:hypothetical protein